MTFQEDYAHIIEAKVNSARHATNTNIRLPVGFVVRGSTDNRSQCSMVGHLTVTLADGVVNDVHPLPSRRPSSAVASETKPAIIASSRAWGAITPTLISQRPDVTTTGPARPHVPARISPALTA